MATALKARLDVRLSSKHICLIQQAADRTGQSVSDFAVSTLTEAAQRIVERSNVTVLSDRDREKFLAVLDANEPPNPALRKAAKR